jgi:hypothetical protein
MQNQAHSWRRKFLRTPGCEQCHVGDAIAFIVADTLERTKNAAEAGAHDISSRRAVENIAAS